MLIGVQNVKAMTFGVNYASTGEDIEITPREDATYDMGINGNIKYTCIYNYTTSVNNAITVDGYDLEDNPIMENSLHISDEDRIIAGTSIGLNIYETKRIGWQVTKSEVTETKITETKYYKCTYKTKTRPLPPPNKPGDPIMVPLLATKNIANVKPLSTCAVTVQYTTSSSSCPRPATNCMYESGPTYSYVNTTEDSYSSTDTTKIEECRKYAAQQAIAEANWYLGASYKITLSDSNNIKEESEITLDVSDTKCDKCSFSYSPGMTSDSIKVEYYYKKTKACINVKTGDISYVPDKSGKTECNGDEREIPNTKIGNNEHWHYFVPLNAKSGDTIEMNMMRATEEILNKSQCLYVMRNNPINQNNTNPLTTTYVDLIKPTIESVKWNEDYKCHTCNPNNPDEWNSEQSSDYKEVIENGCRLTSKIKIPITQKFYNEKTDDDNNKTFNGFNFYYKPIDVSNSNQINIIFPNGVQKDAEGNLKTITLWDKWYKAQLGELNNNINKEPNLSNSYSIKTYETKNINAKQIRMYNQNNPYTSWNNIDIDGTSKYIDSEESVITRIGNQKENIYKLGCGPANKDWSWCK